jgi:hypothetical protein
MLSGTQTSNEYAFKFLDADSSAETADVDFTTNTIRTTSYAVVGVTVTAYPTTTTIKQNEATNVELAKFKLSQGSNNDERSLKFKAITLRNAGTADISTSAEDWKLYKDSTEVSTDYTINGKDITFAVSSDLIANQD